AQLTQLTGRASRPSGVSLQVASLSQVRLSRKSAALWGKRSSKSSCHPLPTISGCAPSFSDKEISSNASTNGRSRPTVTSNASNANASICTSCSGDSCAPHVVLGGHASVPLPVPMGNVPPSMVTRLQQSVVPPGPHSFSSSQTSTTGAPSPSPPSPSPSPPQSPSPSPSPSPESPSPDPSPSPMAWPPLPSGRFESSLDPFEQAMKDTAPS